MSYGKGRPPKLSSYKSDLSEVSATFARPEEYEPNGNFRETSQRGLLSRVNSLPLHLEVDEELAPSLSGIAERLDEASDVQDARPTTFMRTYESITTALNIPPDNELPTFQRQGLGSRASQAFGRRVSTALKSLHTAVFPSARPQPQNRVEKDELVSKLNEMLAGKELVSHATFKQTLGLRGPEFADKLFKAIDKNGSGSVSTEQLVSCLLALETGSFNERIAFIFTVISGSTEHPYVTFQQLKDILQASCSEGGIALPDQHVQDMAMAIFKKAKKQPYQTLTLADFTTVLKERPELVENIKLAALPNKLRSASDKMAREREGFMHLSWFESAKATAAQRLRHRGIKNLPFIAWLTFFFYAELAGFGVEFARQDHYTVKDGKIAAGSGFYLMRWSYPIAKASAESMKIVLVIFFFTVSRGLLTFLRDTWLRYIIPFDSYIRMHRHLAYHFFFWSWLHTIAHIINGIRATDPKNSGRWLPFGKSFNPPLLVQVTAAEYFALETQVTGFLMTGILTLGYLFASPWPRNAVWFRAVMCLRWVNDFTVFYITHIAMAISVTVLLIIHPYPGLSNAHHQSTTWAYMAAGLFFYLAGNFLQVVRRRLFACRVQEIKVFDLPPEVKKGAMGSMTEELNGVVELRLSLPRWGFKYTAGQYAQLRVPSLSRLEWHPFTISSAPADPFLMFHIKARGDWTRALHIKCKEKQWIQGEKQRYNGADHEGDDVEMLGNNPYRLTVDINGPYGAPAQEYSKYNVLLLVAASTGVTPFASIVRQLAAEYRFSKCAHCNKVNHRAFTPRKVYFYWVERDQNAPAYLQGVLRDLKREDVNDFLDINIHITSVRLENNDIRHVFTLLGRSVLHEEEGFDAVAGGYVPTPCYFGRPNWTSVFDKISTHHPGSNVGVFVCGPTPLAGEVKGNCNKRNRQARHESRTQKEREHATTFSFHKEDF